MMLKSANLGLRFILELCALAALGYWGFTAGQEGYAKIALGLGAPLAFAVVWGLFLAPASSRRLKEPWLLIAELVLFGLAIGSLFSAGQQVLAVAFALVYIVNKSLTLRWGSP